MSSRSERTRSRILDAARKLLVERGYHGVGLEEVAQAAGVSRQAVYLHFGSKPDLLVALVQYVDEQLDLKEILRPSREAATALEALDRAVDAYALIEPQIYDIARVLHAARNVDPAAEAAWQDRMVPRREGLRRLMGRLAREGVLADGWTVDEAADFVWILLSLHTYESLVIERGWQIPRLVQHLRTVLRRVLVEHSATGREIAH